MSGRIAVYGGGGGSAASAADTSALAALGDPELPTGAIGQTFPRRISTALAAGYAMQGGTGVLCLTGVQLYAGSVATNIVYKSGTTGVTTPTNWWFALYDSAFALLRQTADQTTTAWGASTLMSLALSSTYTVAASGLHYVGIMVKATTLPTLMGHSTSSTVNTDIAAPHWNGTSTTGLTTTAPDPAAAIVIASTTNQRIPYAYIT